MASRWWIKYGQMKSQDLDLRKARKTVIVVSVISLVVLLFVHVNLFGPDALGGHLIRAKRESHLGTPSL
jgi:hypothetical protein